MAKWILALSCLGLFVTTVLLSRRPAEPTLVLVGGGPIDAKIKASFLNLAGGKGAKIVYIPSASSLPTTERDVAEFWWPEHVCCTLLHASSRTEAENADFARPILEANGVWFGGGSQNQLVEIYGGTRVETALKDLLRRGGVIGGTSAGASAVSRVMISESGVSEGLGLLDQYIVDQHFDVRHRRERLEKAVREHPGCTGIGLDLSTAVIIKGRRLQVLGPGHVTVLGNRQAVLCNGDTFCED